MEGNEIVETNCTDIVATPITDDTLISLAEQAERRIDAMTKIKKVSLKLTNKHDWTDQGGKPYLQVSGAEKIARMFGISWKVSEPTLENQEGGHFGFTYKGFFSLAGASIEVIGTRSSKDGFFKKYDYSEKDTEGNNVKKELPPSEIDRGDVKKAAYTNCIGSGITRILGLRNMTYEDLEEFAGITKDMIAAVGYKKKGAAKEDIKSEGALTAIISIADVRKQTGVNAKTKKPWTKFIIKNSEGTEYGTFSESLANTAKEARDAGLKIEVTYKAGQYGNDIEAIKKIEAPERDPGQEG
jgi:hypothetical protein